jgi:carbon-monoxide dehydrogenase medium subunit
MATFYRRLPRFDYIVPKTLEEALKALSKHKGSAMLLAGGTDIVPRLKKREIAAPEYVIDLKGIRGLDTIIYGTSGLTIGPLATINAIAHSPVIQEHYPVLAQAALSMASPQVRNRGTFAGNICSAVPSADSAPSLLALGAAVKIKSSRGERTVPLDQFFTGPRTTALKANEMLLEIKRPTYARRPPQPPRGYLKLSPSEIQQDLCCCGVAASRVSKNGNLCETSN